MAIYYSATRTSYFRVRDEAAFAAWAESHRLGLIRSRKYRRRVALTGESDWTVFMGKPRFEPHTRFLRELSAHLADGEIAVLLELASPPKRHLVGCAAAVSASGDCAAVDFVEGRPLKEERRGARKANARK